MGPSIPSFEGTTRIRALKQKRPPEVLEVAKTKKPGTEATYSVKLGSYLGAQGHSVSMVKAP